MSTILGTISATTHRFCRGKVEGDDSCLYSSFRYVNGTWNAIDNKRVRSLVTGKNENLRSAVVQSDTSCKTVDESRKKTRKHDLLGGEPEVRALAMLSRTQIRLVSRTKDDEGKYTNKILSYGKEFETFKECVCILYDEENKRYDPLYVMDDSCKKLTIFSCNDEMVDRLLEKFIEDEFGDCYEEAYEKELPTTTNLINETERVFDLTLSNAPKNLINERRQPSDENLSFSKVTKVHPLPQSCNSDVVSKRKKLAEENTDETSKIDKRNDGNIEQHLQTNFFNGEFIDTTTNSNEDGSKLKMKLEVEPAKKFRGRTGGDFKPKKQKNRKGKPSQPRPPRYFADRNNNRLFYLLIPNECFSPNVIYRVKVSLITRDINGWSYIHPYFKIQADPTDVLIPAENPIYLPFNVASLEEYSAEMKRLLIRLVVVQQTNPQLMGVQQPLEIFSSSNTGLQITKKYTRHRAFKTAYRLHGLRFAFTLYKKEPGETEFRPCDDMQYISQISTEDKKHKIKK